MSRSGHPLFDLDAYLGRIGLAAPPPVSEDGLRALHQAQVFTIPFENLDIHLGRGIDVAPGAIFDKLVRHPRGGYCFELNGLLFQALRVLGFEARRVLARVFIEPGQPSGRTHLAILVRLGGRDWLCDAGFGGGTPRHPLPFETDRVAAQFDDRYRLTGHPLGIMLQNDAGQGFRDYYCFTDEPVIAADIALGNHYTSTAPASRFVLHRTAVLPSAAGRQSLIDYQLLLTGAGEKQRREIAGGQAYLNCLRDIFGIDLGVTPDKLKPLPTA